MRKRKEYLSFIIFLSVVFDIGLSIGALSLSYYLRFYSDWFPSSAGIPHFSYYFQMAPVLAAVFVGCMSYFKMYRNDWNLSNWNLLSGTLKAAAATIFVMMSFSFSYRAFSYSRLVFFICAPILAVLGFAEKEFLAWLQTWLCRVRNDFKKIVIVGSSSQAVEIYRQIEKSPRWGGHVKGFVLEAPDPEFEKEFPVLGVLDDLPAVLDAGVDELIVAVPDIKREKMMSILFECETRLVSFKILPDVFELITNRVEVYTLLGTPVIGLRDIRLHHMRWRTVKRIFDLVVGSILFVGSLPLWLFIAVWVKLDSKGPIFFAQERCGQNRKVFNIYKFRTMRKDAESKTGPVWASEKDDRRTRAGRFLRSTNLDELPQLWNVLRGDMSLVGPRPERPHFVDKFKTDIPKYMYRHMVKSGITGWAQVNGLRGNTPLEDRIRYDLYYIENWSVFMDLKIMVMTLRANKNAY